MAIIDRIGSPAVKVYYDVGNSTDKGYDVYAEIRELGKHKLLCEFHAKDGSSMLGQRAASTSSGFARRWTTRAIAAGSSSNPPSPTASCPTIACSASFSRRYFPRSNAWVARLRNERRTASRQGLANQQWSPFAPRK